MSSEGILTTSFIELNVSINAIAILVMMPRFNSLINYSSLTHSVSNMRKLSVTFECQSVLPDSTDIP